MQRAACNVHMQHAERTCHLNATWHSQRRSANVQHSLLYMHATRITHPHAACKGHHVHTRTNTHTRAHTHTLTLTHIPPNLDARTQTHQCTHALGCRMRLYVHACMCVRARVCGQRGGGVNCLACNCALCTLTSSVRGNGFGSACSMQRATDASQETDSMRRRSKCSKHPNDAPHATLDASCTTRELAACNTRGLHATCTKTSGASGHAFGCMAAPVNGSPWTRSTKTTAFMVDRCGSSSGQFNATHPENPPFRVQYSSTPAARPGREVDCKTPKSSTC